MYVSDLDQLKSAFHQIKSNPKIKSLLLFGADSNKPNTSMLEEVLKTNSLPLLGGYFPEILADGERKSSGFVLIPIYQHLEVMIYHTQERVSLNENSYVYFSEYSNKVKGVFCFLDALWSEKSAYLQRLYNQFGPFVNYLGGGAGSLSFQSFPCLFGNHKVFDKGAVIGLLTESLSVGLAHGWHPISEPIKVTSTSKNAILSLNYKSAFQVYKSFVEKHSKCTFDSNNFFEIAKSYPLGLVKLDDEMIIRDPFAEQGEKLLVVDEVPEGEYIRIMHGDMYSLLKGAEQSVENSMHQTFVDYTQICIDCISRVLFMQQEFDKELQHLNSNQKANGILSIGEIANPHNSALEIFNKTVVVAQWKNN